MKNIRKAALLLTLTISGVLISCGKAVNITNEKEAVHNETEITDDSSYDIEDLYASNSKEESSDTFRNIGFLDDGIDLDGVLTNSYSLLASSRSYSHAPFTEGLLITSLNGTDTDFCVTQRMYELTTGAFAYRYKGSNGWIDWIISGEGRNNNIMIAMFGDSITWGSVSGTQIEKGIPYWVQQKTGYQVTNFGVGSQGWVVESNGENAFEHIKNTDISDYDVVTAMYGVNDWNVPLGTYLDKEEGTIMGNIYCAFESVMERNPDAIFVLLSFTNTSNNGTKPRYRYECNYGVGTESPYTGQSMLEEYKKFCDYYQIPFIDMSHSPINGLNLDDMLSDKVHPSEKGYELLGGYIAGQLESIID